MTQFPGLRFFIQGCCVLKVTIEKLFLKCIEIGSSWEYQIQYAQYLVCLVFLEPADGHLCHEGCDRHVLEQYMLQEVVH